MHRSRRGPEFTRIIEEAEADLRKLMAIPDNYKVLFLQGGASQQFAAIPLNLTQPGATVDQARLFCSPTLLLMRPVAIAEQAHRRSRWPQPARPCPVSVLSTSATAAGVLHNMKRGVSLRASKPPWLFKTTGPLTGPTRMPVPCRL